MHVSLKDSLHEAGMNVFTILLGHRLPLWYVSLSFAPLVHLK